MALCVAFEKNFGLFYFSGGPWYLKSPVVYKNHVRELYFPSTKNKAKISILVHSESHERKLFTCSLERKKEYYLKK